jgi:hypothetical protein
MKPSFFSLFQRSRYRRTPGESDDPEDDLEASEDKWAQRERFAVAAIAYCLKNDRDFFDHFVRNVCRVQAEEDSRQFDILIEEKLWGDLALIKRDEAVAYIIECKISAPLGDHQNPSTKIFWQEGYGHHILARFPDFRTQLRYVVLGFKRKLPARKGPRIDWSQKSWDALEGVKNSPLIVDLYDSLGNLGVGRFRSRITNTMKKAATAENACETYDVLRSAYEDLGLAEGRFLADIACDLNAGWWDFGLAIRTTRREADSGYFHGRLQRAVGSTGAQIGWFGYSQGDRKSGVCFSVWFFCGPKARRSLEQRLKKKALTRVYVQPHRPDGSFEVRMPKNIAEQTISSGDKEWFVKVIRIAAGV